jgi:thioredoxin reductase (NADPH)
MMYDVIIIGKGPSGISASIYTKRAGISTLVIGKDGGSLEKAGEIENYYGFTEPVSGKELVEKGIMQAQRLGVEVITDEVIGISYEDGYKVTTKKGIYESKSIIIATGTNRVAPKIKGLKELEGRGISYCAVCDGFFYRGKDVAVLGSGNYALHETMELLPIAKSVTMLTNGKEPIEYRSEDIVVNSKEIKEVRGTEKVEAVEFTDDTNISVSGVFIAEGTASSVDFARKLGAVIQNNKLLVDENMATNLPGLYAAGDCTGGLLQVSKSVYEGARAGTEAVKYVRGLNKK